MTDHPSSILNFSLTTVRCSSVVAGVMRSTMLFGNMQFSVSQFLKTGSLNSANAVSIFFGNFTVALDVVAGHQREWRKPAYTSSIESLQEISK
jgi:hypothetical protein